MLLAACAANVSQAEFDHAPGALVLLGGGRTPDEIAPLALRLAGGPDSRVVIMPWASGLEERGYASKQMYLDAGARNVVHCDEVELGALPETLRSADLIWIPGGSQSRLMEALNEHNLVAPIQHAHARGAVVGGTSAGTAAATATMIAGDPDETGIRSAISKLGAGLGLWPGVIVDQHFVERRRQSRLLSAVLDGPERIGVGVGERTAVILHGDTLRVVGEGSVLVYDAREALLEPSLEPGGCAAATGIRLHVLRDGMRLTLGSGTGR